MTEVHMLVGVPGSGKSREVAKFPPHVYLSRDKDGGRTAKLVPKMVMAISEGAQTIVLDCTFLQAEDRKPFIEAASRAGTSIHCKFLDVTKEQAQFNLCWRMCERYGHVLRTEEIRDYAKRDPNMFPAEVIYRYFKKVEKPEVWEGFSSVEVLRPEPWDLPAEFKNEALIVDYDGTVRDTKSGNNYPCDPSDIAISQKAAKKLKRLSREGLPILGASNQSGVAKGLLTMEMVKACFDETNRQLGVDIDYAFDYSRSGPITSWHRKPMPGIGMDFIWKYRLDPNRVTYVGDLKTDETFAKRCRFRFEWASDYFG